MGNLIKYILIILLVFFLLSCERATRGDRNIPIPQNTDQIVDTEDEDTLHIVGEFEAELTNLTLIPSVEPELLRNVMPNSWQKLERLTTEEKRVFISENMNVLLEIEKSTHSSYFSIFRQQVGADIFYRIITTTTNTPDFFSPAVSFGQFLIHQNVLLLNSAYNFVHATQHGYLGNFESVDIIPNSEGAKGVLVTRVSVTNVDRDNPYDWSRTSPRKNGQLFGSTEGRFFFMSDLLYVTGSYLGIVAPDALVTSESPLRYSLQNAFDGDPATRFIADANDGIIKLELWFSYTISIEKIAIINNYNKYDAVNIQRNGVSTVRISAFLFIEEEARLERISLGEWVIDGNAPCYQTVIMLNSPPNTACLFLNFTGERTGTMYNTISLADLNIKTKEGWLFGDINEQ